LDFKQQLLAGFTDEEKTFLVNCLNRFDKNMDSILEESNKWTV
jgi:hypothetical protein